MNTIVDSVGKLPAAVPAQIKFLDDAANYYSISINPDDNFNRVEITLSHLFRNSNALIGNSTYGARLYEFLKNRELIADSVVEFGGGLGDVMHDFILADRDRLITSCLMTDISSRLLLRQRQRMSVITDRKLEFIKVNCQHASDVLKEIKGLAIANGVIADLPSFLLEDGDDINGITDGDELLTEFIETYKQKRPYYIHIGALRFLATLREMLRPGAAAIITEYKASPRNQPSWFDNHYECGIDFDQIQCFAEFLRFSTQRCDISDVLGLDRNIPLLSVDVFTMKDAISFSHPKVMDLWRIPGGLPIAAYSRETLVDTISHKLDPRVANSVVDQLRDLFHPLDAVGFDRKNPTTWDYEALILTVPRSEPISALIAQFQRMLARGLDRSPTEMQGLATRLAEYDKMTGIVDPAILSSIVEVLQEAADPIRYVVEFGEAATVAGYIFKFFSWCRQRIKRGELSTTGGGIAPTQVLRGFLDETDQNKAALKERAKQGLLSDTELIREIQKLDEQAAIAKRFCQ